MQLIKNYLTDVEGHVKFVNPVYFLVTATVHKICCRLVKFFDYRMNSVMLGCLELPL
jgi:hypothetical protein